MKKLAHILTGWGKGLGIISISTAEAKLAELRMQQCAGCLFSKGSKVLRIVKGNADYEQTLKCTKCSCPCNEKSLVVDESCPVGKW